MLGDASGVATLGAGPSVDDTGDAPTGANVGELTGVAAGVETDVDGGFEGDKAGGNPLGDGVVAAVGGGVAGAGAVEGDCTGDFEGVSVGIVGELAGDVEGEIFGDGVGDFELGEAVGLGGEVVDGEGDDEEVGGIVFENMGDGAGALLSTTAKEPVFEKHKAIRRTSTTLLCSCSILIGWVFESSELEPVYVSV